MAYCQEPLSSSLSVPQDLEEDSQQAQDLEGSEGENELSNTYFSASVSLCFSCCSLLSSAKFSIYIQKQN